MPIGSKSLVGPGRFQWNAGAWFGSALGCSAWMLVVCGFLAYHKQPMLALVPLMGFSVVVFTALFLWMRRDRVYPFTALMTLLASLAVVMPSVWIVVSKYASRAALAAMEWPVSAQATLLVSAGAPLLMVWFLILERSALRQPKHG